MVDLNTYYTHTTHYFVLFTDVAKFIEQKLNDEGDSVISIEKDVIVNNPQKPPAVTYVVHVATKYRKEE